MAARLTLALTHFNRYEMVCQAIDEALRDPRIDEIVISDDASTDGSWERLVEDFAEEGDEGGWVGKVRLYRNPENLDCYANKAAAVRRASNEWVILFDSDNVLGPEYLDALDTARPWLPTVAYLPTFAQPTFDYRAFAGLVINRKTVAAYMDRPMFSTALNTANYVVHRASYLAAWDPYVDPGTADSIFMNYRWLDFGYSLFFVPGMEYGHRVHEGSHFMMKNSPEHERFKRRIETKLRGMH